MKNQSMWNVSAQSRLVAAMFVMTILTLSLGETTARAQLDPTDYTSLGTLTAVSGDTVTIDTTGTTPTITITGPGATSFTGVTQTQAGAATIAVFDFGSISIAAGATVTVTGSQPLALLSQGNASVLTTIDASGGAGDPTLGSSTPGTAVLGGGNGGAGATVPGVAATAGTSTFNNNGGGIVASPNPNGEFQDGAGGGEGGVGGLGGAGTTTPGNATGVSPLTTLVGGGGGGGGPYNNITDDGAQPGGGGGAGGGAIEIVASGTLTVSSATSNGGTGGGVNPDDGNLQYGGGGAGGALVLSGSSLVVTGTVGATGGSGVFNTAAGAGGGGEIALVGTGSWVLGSATVSAGLVGVNSVVAGGGTGGTFGGQNGFGGTIEAQTVGVTAPAGQTATFDGTSFTNTLPSQAASGTSPAITVSLGNNLILDGGTMQFTAGAATFAGSFTITSNNGTVDTQGFSDLVTSTITGAGSLTKIGSGTLALSSANNYTGGTTIAAGTIKLDIGTALSTGPVVLDTGGTLDLAGNSATVGDFSGTGGTVTNSGGGPVNLTFGTANDEEYDGVIQDGAGGVGIVKQGSGAETLAGNNTYSGGTTINAGTIVAGSDTALGASTSPLDITSGELDMNGNSLTVGSFSGTGAATVTSASGSVTLTLNGNINSTYAGVIQDGGGTVALVQGGSNIETLSGNNTYSGGTTINNGAIRVASNTALGAATGSLTINAGLLDLHGHSITVGDLSGTGGTITTNITNSTLTFGGSGTDTYAGTIEDDTATLGLTKQGSGTEILTGDNTYSAGTTINAGTLQVGDGATANGSLGTGAVVDNAALVLAPATTNTFANDISGTGTVTQNGSGTTILTSTNNVYSGGTTVTSGTLQVGDGTTSNGSIGTSTVTDDAALVLDPFTANTITNAIGGTGTVTQIGSSSTTLTNTNTYTGTTSILGGTLVVNGSLASGSAVTVGGALATGTPTLTGTGAVNGAVTISSAGGGAAGAINPGGVGTIGTLTVGSITFQAGGVFDLDMSGVTTDKLIITGAALINSGADIDISATGLTLSNYVLATAASGLNSHVFTVIGSLPAGYTLVETATSLDLEELAASQTFTSPSPATINIITGQTTTVTASLNNTASSGGPALAVNLADNGGTGGTVSALSAASGATVPANSSTNVTGTFTGGTVGTGETWSISNTDPSASPTVASTGGTANVYNHSAPTLTPATGNNQSGIVGSTLSNATFTLSNTTGNTPAPLDVNTLSNLTGTTGSGVVASGGTGTYTSTALDTSTPGVGQTLPVSLNAGDQQTVIGANPLSNLTGTVTYNVYNHSAPTLTVVSGNNQSVFVNGSLAPVTVDLANTAGNTPAPLDVNTLSNLTGTTGSGVVASGGTGAYTATGFDTSAPGVGQTLSTGLNAGDQQTVVGANPLVPLSAPVTYNVYNHAAPTLVIATGNNQSGIVGSTLANATFTLSDTAGNTPAPLDVNTLSSLTGTTGSGVVASGGTGTYTSTALSTASVGVGQTLGVSLDAGDQQTIPGANPLSNLTGTVTYNVYNHSAPTLVIATGNNQSGIVGSTLTDATFTLSDTAGNTPAPLDVNTLDALTGATGSGVVGSGSTGTYTTTALDTSTPGVGQTLGVSLNAGDQQTVVGANPLSNLTGTVTYNVYNHSAPTLTVASGNNQSVFVNGSLAPVTLDLADTAGNTPAPLDVNTLSNLTGATGSGVVASGGTGTYTATGFDTSTPGVGQTLPTGLNAGDQQTIVGANPLAPLSAPVTFNVYNHSAPTLVLATGNNQSGIVGSTLADATFTLSDTAGNTPAPLDVNTLSNLTGATGSGVVASGGTGTYTSTALSTAAPGVGQTLGVSLDAGDQQTIPGANPLSNLTGTVTYNVYNHSAPTLVIATGNNQSAIVGNALANATFTLSDTTGNTPAPLDVNTLSNLTGTTGSGVVASGGTGTYTSTALDTSTPGVGQTLPVSLNAGDQQTVVGANPLSTLTGTVTYNVYNHSAPTLMVTSGNDQSVFVNGAFALPIDLTLADTAGIDPAPLDVNTLSNLAGATGSGVVASGGTGVYTATGLDTTAVGVNNQNVGLNTGDQQTIVGANPLSLLTATITYNVFNHATSNLTTGTLTLGIAHVGYANPITSTNNLTATNGAVGDDRVDLQGSAPAQGNLSLTTLSGIASGGSGNISATLATGQAVGTINTPFTYTFADQSAIVGALNNVGTATITVTGEVYSGQSVWAATGTSGSWGTLAGTGTETFGINWSANQGSPGLDPGFTGVDTATFGTVGGGSSTDTVNLNAAAPNLNSITFNSATTSYTLAQGTGTNSITLSGTTPTINDTAGMHTISAPLILGADTGINVSAGQQLTISGVISGGNALTNSGAGTTILSNVNTYSGGTTLSNGTLAIANPQALSTGAVSQTGGILETAGPNDTITMANGFNQTGGVLALNVTGVPGNPLPNHPNNDQVNVTGTANLSGSLLINYSGGALQPNTSETYTVITTTGGITAIGAGYQPPTLHAGALILAITGQEDPGNMDNFDITITASQGSFGLTGLTPNQMHVATYLDGFSGTATGPTLTLIQNLDTISVDINALGGALNQLMPLNFAHFASSTAFNDGSFLTEQMDNYVANHRGEDGTFVASNGGIDYSGLTVNDPNTDSGLQEIRGHLLAWSPPPAAGLLSDSTPAVLGGVEMKDTKAMAPAAPEPSNPLNMFIAGDVILAQDLSDHESGNAHDDSNTSEGRIGVDYAVTPHFLVGGLFNFSHTDVTLDTLNSSATVDTYMPGAYASYADSGWFANAIAGYGFTSYTQDRNVSIGTFQGVANSAPTGDQVIAGLDGGYEFHRGNWTYGPTAGLQYIHLDVNGYSETGLPGADLVVDRDEADSLRSRLGGRASYAFHGYGLTFAPHLDASWQHEFMDDGRGITSQFSGIGAGTFEVTTQSPSRDSVIATFGFDTVVDKTFTVFTNYSMQAGQDNYFGQSVQAGVKVGF